MKTRKIKTFSLDGEAIDQEAIIRLRPQLESYVIDDMRSKGYVPALDVTPELFWEWDQDGDVFKYLVVIYGSFVGKKRSKEIFGMLGNHEFMFEPHEEKYNENKPE
jgi:hypothetical protein